MDEPCSALDPIATAKIEDLIHELGNDYSIVIVTHSMQQAQEFLKEQLIFILENLLKLGKQKKYLQGPSIIKLKHIYLEK